SDHYVGVYEAMVSDLRACAGLRASIDKVAMTQANRRSQASLGMDRVDRLHLSHFMKHLHEVLAQLVVIHSHKGFALLADQLQKSIVICASQHHYVVYFSRVQAFVVVKKTIDDIAVAIKYFLC